MRNREPRRKVSIRARMRLGGCWIDIEIRNISSRGALVHVASPPAPGTYIEIRRADQILIGRSVWRDGEHFGVRTQDRLDVRAIVSGGPARAPATESERHAMRNGDAQARDEGRTGDRLDRSRHLSRAMQFGAIATAGVAVALLGAVMAHDLLRRPLDIVERHMRGEG